VRNLSGCYTIMLGSWSGPLPAGPAAHTPPAQFRLDTTSLALGAKPRFAVEPAHITAGRMAASWAVVPGDSIEMFSSAGYVGVTLRFAVRGESLVGVARTFHDAHYIGEPPDPSATAIALRTRCSQ